MTRTTRLLAIAAMALVELALIGCSGDVTGGPRSIADLDSGMSAAERVLTSGGGNRTELCVKYQLLCEQGAALCGEGDNAERNERFCGGLETRCTVTRVSYCGPAADSGPQDARTPVADQPSAEDAQAVRDRATAPDSPTPGDRGMANDTVIKGDGGAPDAPKARDGASPTNDGPASVDSSSPSVDSAPPREAGPVAGPEISEVKASAITDRGATISWSLNEVATGQVEYGETRTYGLFSKKEPSLQYTAHTQLLSGLSAGTLYHYRVHSTNGAGGESISGDYTFTTNTVTPIPGGLYPPDVAMSASKAVPAFARPGYLTPVKEPTFGTTMMRITDAAALGASGVSHAYSKVQPWNKDGTLFVMGPYLLDGNTYAIKSKTFPRVGNMRWSYLDPNTIFGFGGGRAVRINASTEQSTTIASYTEYPWGSAPGNGLGFGEGNISWDDTYAALATQGAGGELVIKVLNLKTGSFESSKTFPITNGDDIDWVSMSPSGRYVVVLWRAGDLGVVSYDRVTLNKVANVFPYAAHGDLGYDMAGNEVAVQVVCGGDPNRSRSSVMMSRLDNGTQTVALSPFPGNYCGHISTRNVDRRGWAYLTDGGPTGEIYAVKLDSSGTVERFAHTRTTASTYEAQAKSAVSPDGTKVVWTSDWGTAGGEVHDYVVWQQ